MFDICGFCKDAEKDCSECPLYDTGYCPKTIRPWERVLMIITLGIFCVAGVAHWVIKLL